MVDDLKSSAHVWGDKNNSSTEDSPPAYSGATEDQPSAEAISQERVPSAPPPPRRPVPRTTYDPLRKLSALSQIQYKKYNVPDGLLSPDNVSTTVKHSDFHSKPVHLLPFILEQASLPPKPTLRITGSHDGNNVDFDIVLHLSHLLNLTQHQWKFDSAQVSPFSSGAKTLYDRDDQVMTTLATSVTQFCKDRSENKSYTLTRTVEGLPTDMLAGHIRNLAASVKYRGLVRIDFTWERSKVIVHKQPSSWFSNMLRLHPEKKYEMVETVWDLSDPTADGHDPDAGLRAGQEWWQSWAGTIRNAIISKYKGNVGIEDWIESKMGRIEPDPRSDWGRDYQS